MGGGHFTMSTKERDHLGGLCSDQGGRVEVAGGVGAVASELSADASGLPSICSGGGRRSGSPEPWARLESCERGPREGAGTVSGEVFGVWPDAGCGEV